MSECNDSSGEACVDLFPWNERFDDKVGGDILAKVNIWEQTGLDFGATTSDDDDFSFDDLSCENPYDVAKRHRGYIDGDFIMLLYAWSPNWLANTVGHDNYNLYIRRSFDRGHLDHYTK